MATVVHVVSSARRTSIRRMAARRSLRLLMVQSIYRSHGRLQDAIDRGSSFPQRYTVTEEV
jgi:hypothetical protein